MRFFGGRPAVVDGKVGEAVDDLVAIAVEGGSDAN